jgi:hypothetical protein
MWGASAKITKRALNLRVLFSYLFHLYYTLCPYFCQHQFPNVFIFFFCAKIKGANLGEEAVKNRLFYRFSHQGKRTKEKGIDND